MFPIFYKINLPILSLLFLLLLSSRSSMSTFLHVYVCLRKVTDKNISLEIAEIATHRNYNPRHGYSVVSTERRKRKKEIVRGVNNQFLCGDLGAKVMSVVTERVRSDKTGLALTK